MLKRDLPKLALIFKLERKIRAEFFAKISFREYKDSKGSIVTDHLVRARA